jgi:uncharacterized protein (UPF0333 family)
MKIFQKGQAALEFLTTYAWVLLIILIMVGALAYFGILNPSKLFPDRCNFGSELGCMNYKIASNSLQLKLRNNVGNTIIIDAIAVSTKKNKLSCNSPIIGKTWEAGNIEDIAIVCDFTGVELA